MAEALIPPPPGFVMADAMPPPPPGFVTERRRQPRTAAGVLDALEAGWEGSGTGLAVRGKLPDVVLGSENTKWYEQALADVAQVGAELPQGVAGAMAGGRAGAMAGSFFGPAGAVIGGVLGAGAGAFGIPALLRSSLIEAYKSGTAETSGGFLASSKIILKTTAKESLVGAATMGVGAGVARVAGSAMAPAVGTALSGKAAVAAAETAGTVAEIGTMVVSSSALEGKLPEWSDFLNAAVVVGGLKASVGVAKKMGDIYARTGIRPEEVAAMSKADPTIREDLVKAADMEAVSQRVDPREAQLKTAMSEIDALVARHKDEPKYDQYFRGASPDSDRGAARILEDYRGDWSASLTEFLAMRNAKDWETGESLNALTDSVRGTHIFDIKEQIAQAEISRLERSGAELPRAFQEIANETAAREAILDPATARAFVEKPFAEVPQAPGTPKVKLNVNYDYINSPAEAKAALARATELYGPQILEQTRGKVSWEATERDAAQSLAEMTGAGDFRLLMPREPGTASSATELLLRRQILEGAVSDFTNRARSYDPAKSPPEQAVQMMAAAERVAMLSSYFQGAASEAGRALNILKNARESARSAEEVAKLLKTYDRDPGEIARIMQQADNPVQAAAAARAIVKATPWEKVQEGLKAAMLSGPVTFTANIIGNATTLPLRPIIDAVAVPIGLAQRIVQGKPTDRVRAVEPIARVMGNWQGAVDALILANKFLQANWRQPMEGLRQLDQLGSKKVEVQKRAIEGDLGVIVRSPFLSLSVPDQLFRLMIERGEINTMAARMAAKEGHTPYSREFREAMARFRDNMTPDQLEQAAKMADRGTFNADLGTLGKSVQDVVKNLGPVGFVIAPFVRTPLNLLKEMTRLTPAAPFVKEWNAAVKAGGPEAQKALAEIAVGGVLASIVIGLAQSGKITGAGDTDPNKQRVKLSAGEQPYSYQSEDGTWHEYSRLQPIGTLMGLAADFSKIWDAIEDPEKRDDVAKMIAAAFANGITNQTMLMGMTNLIRAMSEPDRFGERFIYGLATMPVPGALSQVTNLNDEYVREIYGVMDAFANKGVGDREALQPKIDIWGAPIENRERVGGVGPVRMLQESNDKVKTEAARVGLSVPKTAEKIVLPGSKDRKIGEVEMTPEQRTAYAMTAGQTAYRIMEPLVKSPEWDALPDVFKRMSYEKAFARGREVARAQVLSPAQLTVEAERIRGEWQKQLAR